MDSIMRRDVRISRILKVFTCALLFAGLFAQILMLAEISAAAKGRVRAERETNTILAESDNLKLQIAKFTRTTWIEEQATALGMHWPNDDQIRVISLPLEYTEASTHTAEITGSR